MRNTKLVFVIFLFFTQPILASEFFHRAATGVNEAAARVGYDLITTNAKDSHTDIVTSGIDPFLIQYERGISNVFSLGLNVSYISTVSDSGQANQTTANGLADPRIYLRGSVPVSLLGFDWQICFGADLGVSLNHRAVNSSGDQTNGSSGGMSLQPYVGVERPLVMGSAGARVQYRWLGERVADINGSDASTTGGNSLIATAFYEYVMSDVLYGADFIYEVFDSQSTSTLGSVKSLAPFSAGITEFYLRVPWGPRAQIIAVLDYGLTLGGERFDKYNPVNVSLASRWAF